MNQKNKKKTLFPGFLPALRKHKTDLESCALLNDQASADFNHKQEEDPEPQSETPSFFNIKG